MPARVSDRVPDRVPARVPDQVLPGVPEGVGSRHCDYGRSVWPAAQVGRVQGRL